MFTVGGSGALITLTRLVSAANDSTMNIRWRTHLHRHHARHDIFEYTARLYLLSGFERRGHIAWNLRRTPDTGKVNVMPLKFLIKHGTEWFAPAKRPRRGLPNCR